MKTFLLFTFTLTVLLAGAFLTNGRRPDAALVMASAISAGITAWTLRQYDRKFIPLLRASPWQLRLVEDRREPPAPPLRWAA